MNLGVKDFYYKETEFAEKVSSIKSAQITYFRSDESASSSSVHAFSYKSNDSLNSDSNRVRKYNKLKSQ